MRAPLKKILIARYVLYLEILGFLIMGTIIAGMVFCVVKKIDDGCDVKTDTVTAKVEAITLSPRAYVEKSKVKDGDQVKKGQALLTVRDNESDVAVMEARLTLSTAASAIKGLAEGAGVSSVTLANVPAAKPIVIPPEVTKSVTSALAGSKAIELTGEPSDIVSPVDGIVKGDLAALQGAIKEGKVAEVHNFDSLRFTVPVSGKNADRVRINLLGGRDILDWKEITRTLKSDEAPESAPTVHVWQLAQDKGNTEKLKFVGKGKVPDATGKTNVLDVLNGMIRKKDFYDAKVWPKAQLSEEAKKLAAIGTDKLTENELYRLNRILMETAFPKILAVSRNEHQKVKAKIIIPQPSTMVDGKEKKAKPVIFKLEGTTLGDKDTSNKVLVELYNPTPDLQEQLKKRLTQSDLSAMTMTGSIVVGRIPMFRFLFSKE